jgi:hypothetical protein
MSTHLKNSQVATESGSNIIHIYESYARLTNNQRIGWGQSYPIGNVGLKIDYTGMCKVKVVSPASSNRIRLNPCMIMLLEKGQKSFPHIPKTEFSASERIVDKG